MLTAEIKEALLPKDHGITLIITVGNSFRKDDGVGTFIAKNCLKLINGLVLLDAGDKPENIIDKAIALKPFRAVIIDAANFNGQVGEARVIDHNHIPASTLSTHTFPLPVVAKMIEEDARAQVIFLGIQPAKIELGEGLSEAVKSTAEEIIKLITEN